MAFRIGKSVMLNFGDDLEAVFIFVGLAMLLLIGPLFRWYYMAMTKPDFKLEQKSLFELLPFVLIFVSSLFVTQEWYENSELVIIVFASGLLFIYLHLAFYIGWVWHSLHKKKRTLGKGTLTKSQKAIITWLQYLAIGLSVIWLTYVMNILDGAIPYIIGPIVYSIVIYFLSFKAFQLKTPELDGAAFGENNDQALFGQLVEQVVKGKLYLESDLTLSKLGGLIGKPPQITSGLINQYANRNFNDFVNYYRIQEAKQLLSQMENQKFTISSIAFDTGFSSLSSFNSAFKKFEGMTPSVYRKSIGQ
ncbi:helix-turn-helix domain-containing protein [Muricauda sp. 2012CJ35-5]|uniref:Helix-turn-helix domain-containing protein n=1 Tax=Flagellimonas spongiicola TaxID=2942208 RepID=A0ABT0PPR4_9FLAO|nr:helix-turn-helix domain-containing protein [Allomuricauda spongiicola]MCL6273354.1 helix-turn-helix domain-containing protein [Allomuricauda spongiicola]